MRKTMKSCIGIGFVCAVTACGWWQKNGQTVVSDIGGLAACAITHEQIDPDPTFEGIAEECAPLLASDVEAIVAAEVGTADAGSMLATRAKMVHHRAAKK